jgi:hypothetical protein
MNSFLFTGIVARYSASTQGGGGGGGRRNLLVIGHDGNHLADSLGSTHDTIFGLFDYLMLQIDIVDRAPNGSGRLFARFDHMMLFINVSCRDFLRLDSILLQARATAQSTAVPSCLAQ